jgi:hypothetical protein
MNRSEFVAALAAATATPRAKIAPGVAAEILVEQDSTELLAPFKVSISLRNTSTRIISVDFPTTDLYRIDVRHEDDVLWSTATLHKPIQIGRKIDVPPGVLRLASQLIDGTTDDKRAYDPGHYTVRVTMLGSRLTTTLERPVEFVVPMPIVRALKTALGKVVTIWGTSFVEAGIAKLRDDSGSVRLSHVLGARPNGKYVVRGYLDALGDERQFVADRFAPAFDNVPDPKPT